MEDDHFRYLWDGRQLGTGANPYATAPADHFGADAEAFDAILDQINYPHVRTIYGPVAQAGFALSYWIAPGKLWPWKLIVIGCDLLLVGLVIRLSRPADGQSHCPAAALIAGWCPLSVFETSFNAHPDIIGVTLLVGAIVLWRKGRVHWCAALCAFAVGAKVFALLIAPFLLGRKGRTWVVFAAALLAVYLPFVLWGATEFDGLRAFAADWEFNSSLHGLLAAAAGARAAQAMLAILFVAIWLYALGRWQDSRTGMFPPGDIIFGAFFLCAATVNPWYLLWLLPFVALRPTVIGVTAMAAISLSYVTFDNLGLEGGFGHPQWLRPIEYGLIALAGACDATRRMRPRRVNDSRMES